MTSILNVDTIADKAGTGPVGLTKQMAPKGWSDTNATGTTINGSFNISSLTDASTGQQTHNFTNSFSNANYCAVLTVRNNVNQIWIEDSNKAAGSAQGRSYTGSAYQDNPQDVLFTGDLA